jgi:hypothetical protein
LSARWLAEVPPEPQREPAMVIWELDADPEREPTPAERAAADALVEQCWQAAERHGPAGYRLLHGDKRHYYNEAAIFDDAILDPDRPEFLMYYGTPKGQKLAGMMFYTRRPEERGPQLGGASTRWHYHIWAEPNCLVDGLLSVASAGDDGRCERGTPEHRSPEMIHVWLLEHPEGPFATSMWLRPGQLRALIERDLAPRGERTLSSPLEAEADAEHGAATAEILDFGLVGALFVPVGVDAIADVVLARDLIGEIQASFGEQGHIRRDGKLQAQQPEHGEAEADVVAHVERGVAELDVALAEVVGLQSEPDAEVGCEPARIGNEVHQQVDRIGVDLHVLYVEHSRVELAVGELAADPEATAGRDAEELELGLVAGVALPGCVVATAEAEHRRPAAAPVVALGFGVVMGVGIVRVGVVVMVRLRIVCCGRCGCENEQAAEERERTAVHVIPPIGWRGGIETPRFAGFDAECGAIFVAFRVDP